MVFNSFYFIYFFSIVFMLYWSVGSRYRWIILLISSYFMFGFFNPYYVALLLLSTFIDYFLAATLISSSDKTHKKIGLLLSIILNLGLLFSFKYVDFFIQQLNTLSSLLHFDWQLQELHLLLPVGISFYTFQTLSYSIDVYRGEIKAEKNVGKFALFVAFFPQLVAGPIERAKDLLPQFSENRLLTVEHIKKGFLYILVGYFFKIAVADQAGTVVDPAFLNLYEKSGSELVYAMFHFSIQIYTDFAGYSFLALGVAQFFAINLMVNFKSPYLSQSFTSFWRTWHISLSIWARDYLYIPLGGKTKGRWMQYRNILIVFLIIGFWHGAGNKFLLWGLLHAFFLILEKILRIDKDSTSVLKWIRILITFIFLTLLLIPIRSADLSDTLYVFEKIATFDPYELYFLVAENRYSPASLAISLLIVFELLLNKKPLDRILTLPLVFQCLIYLVFIFSIVLLGYSEGAQFIYFQF